jgi:hypothetical protein
VQPVVRRGVLVSVAASAAAIGLVLLGFAAWDASRLYDQLIDPNVGWRGTLHRADPELGYALVPGASGAQLLRGAPDVPMAVDPSGFRVPVAARAADAPARPLVLALGCSFTFGDGVAAESTFAQRVGELLGGSTINAGVGGYGLAQMLLVARRLIPAYRPDVVLVQYSPWLVERALQTRAPITTGEVPTPYFAGSRKELRLAPPRFQAAVFAMDAGRHRAERWSWSGLASFLARDGLPLVVHDRLADLVETVATWRGTAPAPTTDPDAVIAYVYRDIARLARRSGASLVVVALGIDARPLAVPRAVRATGALVVEANASLRRRLAVATDEAYRDAYWQKRAVPPYFDAHPNERAHGAIADAIVARIRAAAPQR